MTMNANDVIESYVADVAVQLPRRQRNDVAFELRALIAEGLQDKAEAAGRDVDAAMAIEFLRAFGRPGEVAASYRPALTIIDPADGRSFLRASVIGLVVIWSAGLLVSLQQPIDSGWDLLQAIGQGWWLGVVIPSMWWPGVLVTWFAASAWARRRRPQSAQWKPRTGEPTTGGRAAMVLGLVGMVCGVLVLLEPRWVLDFFWGGRAAPQAYEALTYTESFLHRQAPWLLLLLVLEILMFAAAIASDRWAARMRRFETALSLPLCAVMAWTVLDGPVFKAQSSDGVFKLLLALIILATLAGIGIKLYRRVRPAPDRRAHA
jgi:hypothetical protein